MGIYLLKSVVCLGAFLAFYHLILEHETAHKFKRFYLLSAVVLSFVIPNITFTEYVEVTLEPVTTSLDTYSEGSTISLKPEQSINYLNVGLWVIYGLGVLVFSIRFSRNLLNISKTIRNNYRIKTSLYTKVLMLKSIVPHSFFNYIFINRNAFEEKAIPHEVLQHEEAHVLQKHSVDIILIELLQIIFWFNPLFVYLKHAVKLNHEYLADAYVIQRQDNIFNYQNLLINFSSCPDHTALTSPLNYSLTKKRILMLSKRTSKNLWIKRLLLLPLVAILTLSFSTKKDVINYVTIDAEENEPTSIEEITYDNTHEMVSEIISEKATITETSTETEKARTLESLPSPMPINSELNSASVFVKKKITLVVTESIIVLNDEVVSLANLTKRLDKLTKKWSKAELKDFDLSVSFSNVSDARKEKINEAFKTSNLGKANPEKDAFMPPKPPRAPRALRTERESINRTERNARRLEKNAERMEKRIEKQEERLQNRVEEQEERRVQRMGLMEERLENASEERVLKMEERQRMYEEAMEERAMILAERQQMIDERGEYIKKRYKDGRVVEVLIDDNEMVPPVPPMPPMPPLPPEIEPLDLIVDMAKKGATFSYDGKTITSDKAIDIVKKNKDINILANPNGKEGPYVKLSTEPIKLK